MNSSPEHVTPALPRVVFWIAVAFSAFQVYTAAFSPLSSQVVRAIHVGFVLLMVFALMPGFKGRSGRYVSWALGVLGFTFSFYHWIFEADLTQRAGQMTDTDMVIGIVTLVLVFEAARRVMGWALPIICGLFLLYGLFGEYLPGLLAHRGYGFDQIISTMSFGTEGIYGTPTYVSSTYIFLFILFGAFLEQAGMITLFTDFALGLVGHARGGAAKVAVVSSSLMGTVSGSGVANVVTTGQFTIPLMKRFGYKPAFAGGVEATASMGGQLMPPVMGAVAFIMAETLNVPYADIVKAAIIPAVLYFYGAFWMVHLEAGKHGLMGMDKKDLPSPLNALKKQWYLVIPLVALVWLLVGGYTPLFAGTVGLAFTVVLILGASVAIGLPNVAIRTLFWVGLGLVCAAFLQFGIWVIAGAIFALVVVNAFRKGGRKTLAACRDSLAEGAKSALPVGVACAMVGVIIGTMTLTGAANTFGQFVVSVGEDNLFLSLLLTMVTCLLLGMGIPTIPNYIITSSIAGPALEQLGVPLIVTHMFVFYFGILADLTPPVALACFAAAPIARERGLVISMQAVKIAAAGFVIPYMAVYTPALMLQDGGPLAEAIGYLPAVLFIVLKTVLAISLWGVSVIGYLGLHLPAWLRVFAMVTAFLLIAAYPVTDGIGCVLSVVFFFVAWRLRRAGASPANAA